MLWSGYNSYSKVFINIIEPIDGKDDGLRARISFFLLQLLAGAKLFE